MALAVTRWQHSYMSSAFYTWVDRMETKRARYQRGCYHRANLLAQHACMHSQLLVCGFMMMYSLQTDAERCSSFKVSFLFIALADIVFGCPVLANAYMALELSAHPYGATLCLLC